MELSDFLKVHYDARANEEKLSTEVLRVAGELAPPPSMPDNFDERREYANRLLDVTTMSFQVFDNVATASINVQDKIAKIDRYISYLSTIVPYRRQTLPKKVIAARNRLNSMRTLFTESLVNEDVMSLRIITAIKSMFVEINRLDEFLQFFSEHVLSSNLEDVKKEVIRKDYDSALQNALPGMITTLAVGSRPETVVDELKKIIDSIQHHDKPCSKVETEGNVLCWATTGSYLDLLVRLQSQTGFEPVLRAKNISQQVNTLRDMVYDNPAEEGTALICHWAEVLSHCAVIMSSTTLIYAQIMDAVYDCLWEFFFFQLSKLEELNETRVLDSVIAACKESIFKDKSE